MIEVVSTIALGLALFALSRWADSRTRKVLDTAWMAALAMRRTDLSPRATSVTTIS